MFCRDSGWIQIFSENTQEAYDNVLQAMRIAEHTKVRLPAMVTIDGFIISHAMETLSMLPDDEVKAYVGAFKSTYSVLGKDPITVGSIDLQNYYFEHRLPMFTAMKEALSVIKEIGKEFGEKYGRHYDLLEKYKLDDAETAIICLGSTAGTAKDVVDALRAKGQKVGLIKIRVFRPFPVEDIAAALANIKVAAILDRSDSLNGFGGPVFTEVCSSLFNSTHKPKIINYIYGLGGRDIDLHMIESVYARLEGIKDGKDIGPIVDYLGVRN
jgi:pyruvate ferredoxin oxidoreductase alpha subunit